MFLVAPDFRRAERLKGFCIYDSVYIVVKAASTGSQKLCDFVVRNNQVKSNFCSFYHDKRSKLPLFRLILRQGHF